MTSRAAVNKVIAAILKAPGHGTTKLYGGFDREPGSITFSVRNIRKLSSACELDNDKPFLQ
jgi:hypothetical protein